MDYRLYYLNNDRICEAQELNFPSDRKAIAFVSELANGQAKELWNLSRRVAVFPAQADAPAGSSLDQAAAWRLGAAVLAGR